jgi:hypothetical protein
MQAIGNAELSPCHITDAQERFFRSRPQANDFRSRLPDNLGVERLRGSDGQYTWWLILEGLDHKRRYNVRQFYESALAKKNPYASPHYAFRALTPRDDYQAVKFLKRFGPLEPDDLLDDAPPGADFNRHAGKAWLSLEHFWAKQWLFAGMLQIYDVLSDPDDLRECWRLLTSRTNEETLKLNDLWCERAPLIASGPPRTDTPDLADWVMFATNHDLRHFSEVALFEQIKGWEMFRLDTERGVLAHLCPHCHKVFFAPRKDRFYCTPRLQQLASKRRWKQNHLSTLARDSR